VSGRKKGIGGGKRSQIFMRAKRVIENERTMYRNKLMKRFYKFLKIDQKLFEEIPKHHGAKNLAQDFMKIRKTLANRTLHSQMCKRESSDWNIDKIISTQKQLNSRKKKVRNLLRT